MQNRVSLTPAFAAKSLVGTTIDGRYRLTGHIASGGMGAVFRAEHVHLHKDVALKVMRPDLAASQDLVERFRREAEIAASLAHDNIVRVSDFGRSPEGYLFFAMDLLEGESLFERLRREGVLSVEEAIGILVQICSGLEAAHRLGVIHRDLKPENVFLHAQRGQTVAKVLDFGVAKLTDPSSRSDTHSGIVVGTPEYVSPEQAMGTAVDARADVYAVGLIAWRMLAGRHPFESDDPRALLMMQASQPVPPLTEARPDLAVYPALVQAIARACAKDVAQRTGSAGDLRAELERCSRPSAATAPSRPSSPSPAPHARVAPVTAAEALTAPVRPTFRLALSLRLARIRATIRRLRRRAGLGPP